MNRNEIILKCKFCNDVLTKRSQTKYCSKECFDNNRINPIDRFWSKIKKTNTCWIWIGEIGFGYGRIKYTYKCKIIRFQAHRFSYLMHFGEIPEDMKVCHKCDNPTCVNPDHLFIGTTKDNVTDRVNKNRSAKGIKNGSHTHPERMTRGSDHKCSKLKESDIKKIRSLRNTTSLYKLGRLFSVSTTTIKNIIYMKAWKHVV